MIGEGNFEASYEGCCEERVSGEGSRGEGQSHFVGFVEVEEEEEEEEDEGVVQGNGEGVGLAWLPSSQDESPIPGSSRSEC